MIDRSGDPRTIVIDDLAEPVLTPAQLDVLSLFPTKEPLDVPSLLAAATKKARTDNFGDPEFLVRLQAQVDAINADQGLNGLGQFVQRQRLVRLLTQRALFTDLLARYPQIHEIEIEQPIIVVGLPRSGTTHLVNLLAADPRRRSLPYWESQEPFPLPGQGPDRCGVDPRFTRTLRAHEAELQTTPHVAAMHDRTPEAIEEEVELLDLDFASYVLEWHARVPSWLDAYVDFDQDRHYAYLKQILQALTFLRGPRRWVLKSPQHLEWIGPLIRTFPDATVAFTHRDPAEVIQSAATMLAYGDRMRRTSIDAPALGTYWVERIERLLRAAVRDRDLIGEHQSLDISFRRFMRDENAVVQAIHARAGLESHEPTSAAIDHYRRENPRGAKGRVRYDLAGDFGIAPHQLRERFAFYHEFCQARFDGEDS